jgi:hypothetical protein
LSINGLFFRWTAGRSGVPAAAYRKYASLKTLVQPCPAKKIHIYI